MKHVTRNRNPLTTPLSERGIPRPLVYLASLFSLVYILNPTLGVFEFIPDNLPVIGNLDEGGAFLLIWYGLLELLEQRASRGRTGREPTDAG